MLTQVLENLCFCICLPIIVPVQATHLVTKYSSKKKAAWRNDVRPLPRRRRKLSIVQPQPPNLDCTFLTKLPLELRLQIYEYVLGGDLLHLIQIPRRIAHIRCKTPPVDHRRRCRPATKKPLDPWLRTIHSANPALLRTCRQIYVEAVPILYRSNTFDVNNLRTFLFFTCSILPQRLAAITTLHLDWHLNRNLFHSGAKRNSENWDDFWNVLATQMPGLRNLKVRLVRFALPKDRSPSVIEPWVLPMCRVRGLQSVEIEMKSANNMGDVLEYEEDLDGEEGREQAKMKMEQRKLIETIKSIMSSKER